MAHTSSEAQRPTTALHPRCEPAPGTHKNQVSMCGEATFLSIQDIKRKPTGLSVNMDRCIMGFFSCQHQVTVTTPRMTYKGVLSYEQILILAEVSGLWGMIDRHHSPEILDRKERLHERYFRIYKHIPFVQQLMMKRRREDIEDRVRELAALLEKENGRYVKGVIERLGQPRSRK